MKDAEGASLRDAMLPPLNPDGESSISTSERKSWTGHRTVPRYSEFLIWAVSFNWLQAADLERLQHVITTTSTSNLGVGPAESLSRGTLNPPAQVTPAVRARQNATSSSHRGRRPK